MAKLSSAIVQRHIASLRDVEEALARQVLYGGDLVTNLLEQAKGVDEGALTALLAESLGIEPAPAGEIPPSSPDVRALIPGDVALRHGLYPLSQSGKILGLAVSERLPGQVEQELSFALGVELKPYASPLVRIRQAISRDYGVPLDRRSLRGIAKLEGRPDPSPSIVPTTLQRAADISRLPRPPSIPPIGMPRASEPPPIHAQPARMLEPIPTDETPAVSDVRLDPSVHEAVTSPAPLVAPLEPRPPTSPGWPIPAPPAPASEPPTPPSSRPTPTVALEAFSPNAVHDRPTPLPAESAALPDKRPTTPAPPPTTPQLAPPPPPPLAVPSAEPEGEAPPKKPSQTSLQAPDLAAWSAAQRSRPSARSRHRGPYTTALAEQDLVAAQDRDEILAAFFDFAAQFFEYSALFAIHGDLAEGRDASGPGASRAEVLGIGVPMDLPSALARTRDERRFQLVAFEGQGLDAQLAKDLRRNPGKKVLLLPVTVRQRCVLIFYGDDGDADVELSRNGEVIAFAPLVENALEGIILKRKLAAHQALADAAVSQLAARASRRPQQPVSRLPPVDERAEALVRALEGARKSDPPKIRASVRPSGPPQPISTPPPPVTAPTTPTQNPESKGIGFAPTQHALRPPRPLDRKPEASQPPVGPALGDASWKPPRTTPPPKPPRTPAPSNTPAPSSRPTPLHGTPGVSSSTPQALSSSPRGAAPAPDNAIPLRRAPAPIELTPVPGPVFELVRRAPSAQSRPPDVSENGWDNPDLAVDRPARAPEPIGEDDAPDIAIGAADLEELPDDSDEALPRSHSMAVEPRAPHKRHSSGEVRLPTVIVDTESDIDKLVQELIGGNQGALTKLKRLGAAGISALVNKFPGPIESDHRGAGRLRASEQGPILAALARLGKEVIPFVLVKSNDSEAKVRVWATRLLGELPSEETGIAVARRVLDKDLEVQRSARDAGKWLQADAAARRTLRDATCSLAEDPGQNVEARTLALEALADWRDPLSIPRLITLVQEASEVGKSAQWALTVLTRQNFGSDVGGWENWWRHHADQHRIEWLIDALMNEDQDLRREAGEELKTLTKEYFGYYDDLPKSERAQAQRRYREWWENTGKARFSG